LPDPVLVTGASGFLGSAVCRHLGRQGYPVRAMHRASSDLAALEGLSVEHRVGDLFDPESLARAADGVRWVFHVAAIAEYWRQPPAEVIRGAVDGTRNILQACKLAGVERLILTSSLAAMGIPLRGEMLTESNVFNLPRKRSPYGYAKRQAEVEALQAAGASLEVVIVNPTIVLGAGDVHQISGSMVIQAARGRTFLYTRGGTNIVHIDDVAAGHIAAARHGGNGERYLLGGENLTYHQLFALLAEVVGGRPPWLLLRDWAIEPSAYLIDLVRRVIPLPLEGNQLRLSRHRLFCDTSKASRELGLPPARPARQAIVEALAWYRARGVV
jgi:dihydroflavonol-4-reductase